MKLHFHTKTEVVGTISIEEDTEFVGGMFTIEDPVAMMQIARKSLYSNPIRVIARELCCNGRDAQREVGKAKTPLYVSIREESGVKYFCVRDYGIGISPSRMEHVFLKYTGSTKRGDNTQTGGFGLGAKSPFSYSDSFSVITYLPDGKGSITKRHYLLYIDPTGAGRADLIAKEEGVTEEQGTLIEVPIKDGDVFRFQDEVGKATQYWSVRPNFSFNTFAIKPDYRFKTSEWGMPRTKGASIVFLDEIAYPLTKSSLDNLPEDLGRILDQGIHLYFNTGELEPAATRENLQFSEFTVNAIVARLQEAKRRLRRYVQKILDACPTLLDASLKWEMGLINYWFEPEVFPRWHNRVLLSSKHKVPDGVLAWKFSSANEQRVTTIDLLRPRSIFLLSYEDFHKNSGLPQVGWQDKLLKLSKGEKDDDKKDDDDDDDINDPKPVRIVLKKLLTRNAKRRLALSSPCYAVTDRLDVSYALKHLKDVVLPKPKVEKVPSFVYASKKGKKTQKVIVNVARQRIYFRLKDNMMVDKNNVPDLRAEEVLKLLEEKGVEVFAVTKLHWPKVTHWIDLHDWAKKRLERLERTTPPPFTTGGNATLQKLIIRLPRTVRLRLPALPTAEVTERQAEIRVLRQYLALPSTAVPHPHTEILQRYPLFRIPNVPEFISVPEAVTYMNQADFYNKKLAKTSRKV